MGMWGKGEGGQEIAIGEKQVFFSLKTDLFPKKITNKLNINVVIKVTSKVNKKATFFFTFLCLFSIYIFSTSNRACLIF